MAAETTTVKGSDLTDLDSLNGKAVKISGRWYWVLDFAWFTPDKQWSSSQHPIAFVLSIPHQIDPRATRHPKCRLRVIYRDEDYPVRDETAPVWSSCTYPTEH